MPIGELAAALAEVVVGWVRPGGPAVVVGLQGGQGSGKSTLVSALVPALAARGFRAVALSLDDLYLGHDERLRLGRAVHPLLATRGVPGTHDVVLAHAVLDALVDPDGGPVDLPVFDKGADDRAPAPRRVVGPFDVVLLEGWCVGLAPPPPDALATPCNDLEAREDPGGAWRAFVADALAGPYAGLWARLDRLVVLEAPSWATITRWRREAEATTRALGGPRAMDDVALTRFLATYERWARHALATLPARADVVVTLGEGREGVALETRVRPPGSSSGAGARACDGG